MRGYKGGTCRPGPLHPASIQVGPACCTEKPGSTHRSPAGLPKARAHWRLPGWHPTPCLYRSLSQEEDGSEVPISCVPSQIQNLNREEGWSLTFTTSQAGRVPDPPLQSAGSWLELYPGRSRRGPHPNPQDTS